MNPGHVVHDEPHIALRPSDRREPSRAGAASRRRQHAAACPPERRGRVLLGLFAHLGSPVAFIGTLAVVGPTPLNVVLCFVGVLLVFATFILVAETTSASVALPKYTVRQFAAGMTMIFIKGVAGGGAVVAAGWWLLSWVSPYESLDDGWWRIAGAVLLTDLGYYWLHRLRSHGRGNGSALRYVRRKHAAHHAVAELDFLRGNESSFVDTALSQFQPSLVVASYALGMGLASTWAAYALILTLQATDHTSVTYDIGWLRYVFMDNHAHKLHHCRGGTRINYAAAFSIFDRLWGTYHEDWTVNAGYLHHHGLRIDARQRDGASSARRRSIAVRPRNGSRG